MAETKIKKLRNLMTPIVNYFAMVQLNLDKTNPKYQKYIELLDVEKDKCIKILPEIEEILIQIPDNACEIDLK